MKRISLLSIAVLLFTSIAGWGQTVALATWNFTGRPATSWGPNLDPSTTNSAVTVGPLSRGSGIDTAGTTVADVWGGNGFLDNVSPPSQTASTAVTANNYFYFTVAPNAGSTMSITELGSCNLRKGSGSGPNNFIWQYSLDGTNFTNIGAAAAIGGSGTAAGSNKAAVNISGITALQNVAAGTTVTFRLLAWTSTVQTSALYFNGASTNPSFSISGTVTSGPLPLDLLSFKGKAEQGINHLDWTTAHESNVSHFDVERGTDGRTFVKVATVKAKGNSDANNVYGFDDAGAPVVAYYRLKMTDADGKYRYSDVVELRSEVVANAVSLYPNPAGATLFLAGLQGKASYYIVNAAGVTVSAPISVVAEGNTVTIDVATLSAGIYFVHYQDAQNKGTLRFVKK